MDSRTEFTFNQPVELPGVTLPPGTYVFRFVDATTGRKVMQVQAKDASNKNVRDVHDDLGAASEGVRRRRAAFPRNACRPAGGGEDVVVSGQHDRPRVHLSEVAGAAPCEGNEQTVLTTQADNVTNDQMKTADLTYVSPSGQETALTDEQLVDAAANTPPVGATATAQRTRRAATAATAGTQEPPMASAGRACRGRAPRCRSSACLGSFRFWAARALRFRA